MNYFRFLTRPRQAVFCLAAAFIISFSAQVFAQNETDQNKPNEKHESKQTADEIAAQPSATVTPKLTFERLTGKNIFESPKPESRKFRAFSDIAATTNNEQQSPADDDTMMGVMGKGTDGVKLGGHVGFVVPIVGRGNGITTNLGDRFVFGFPVGLTLKTKRNIAVDFEFIPTFNTGRDFVLTIHPGIIYGFAKKYAVGVRAAYDAGAGSFGFTPLISRGFKINNKVGFFIEADFPIRSNYRPYQSRFGSIAFAAHAGFAF